MQDVPRGTGPQAGQPASQPALDGEVLAPAPTQPFSRQGKKDLVARGTTRISPRLRKAVERVAEGKNITEAAKLTGMHRNALSQALMRPHVAELLEKLVKLKLASGAGKAAHQLVRLVDASKSDYVRLEAAKAVLDRTGYAQQRSDVILGDIQVTIKL